MKRELVITALLALVTSLPLKAQLDFPREEYMNRRAKLMEQIPDAIIILRGANLPTGDIPFYQSNNMMYFSGLEIPGLTLVMDGRTKSSTLFVDFSEKDAREEGIPPEWMQDPGKYDGIEKVAAVDLSTWLDSVIRPGLKIYTPFRSEELRGEVSAEKTNALKKRMTDDPWDGRLIRELQFVQKLREKYPEAEVKDCWNQISDLRKYKSPAEIAVMREAGRIGTLAHIAFLKAVGVGVKERDLAGLFESTCQSEGATGLAYYTIIMSGKNMAYGHYHRYDRTLDDGDFVILDAGPDYRHYAVDFSSSMPASGKFSAKQREFYELAFRIRKVCLDSYRPGITLGAVGQNVRKYLIDNGYDPDEPRFRGFVRFGGYNHSVGMAVHDDMGTFAGSDEVLKEGFVFACDINMIYADIEMGIRLEDTVVITADGSEVLSAGLPRTVAEVEEEMNHNRNNGTH